MKVQYFTLVATSLALILAVLSQSMNEMRNSDSSIDTYAIAIRRQNFHNASVVLLLTALTMTVAFK
jgi:hypothetical protein